MSAETGLAITRSEAKRAVDTLERKIDYTRKKLASWTGRPNSIPFMRAELKAYRIAVATLREVYGFDAPGDVEREDERWRGAG